MPTDHEHDLGARLRGTGQSPTVPCARPRYSAVGRLVQCSSAKGQDGRWICSGWPLGRGLLLEGG